MSNNNLKRQFDVRVMQNELPVLILTRGVCLFTGFLLAVCLIAVGRAESQPQDPNLLGMLENDLRIEAESQDPNVLDAELTAPENDAPAEEKTAAGTPVPAVQVSNAPSERELWQARISASQEIEDSQSKQELEEVIRKICAIQIDHQIQPAEPEPQAEPESEAGPDKEPPVAEVPSEPTPDPAEDKMVDGAVSERTLQLFKDISQQPEQLKKPFELAEILFGSGCFDEAAMCYQESLRRLDADQPDTFQDKAWMLLQLGNCFQDKEPQTALESYRSVIVECPESPWVSLAKAKSELINWYLQDQPKTLINEVKP